MREYVDKVSVLTASKPEKIRKIFFNSKPTSFDNLISIKSKLLKYFLKISSAELYVFESDKTLSIRALLERLKKAGLIYNYGEGAQFSDYPKLNYVGIFYSPDQESVSNLQNAWGYTLPSENKEIAFSKALGECIERQASYFDMRINNSELPKTYKGDASYFYKLIPKFTEEQIQSNSKLVSSAEDLKNTLGFKAKSLTDDKSRFLPLEAFYWGRPADENQKLFFHATTSGSGGGSTFEQAILSAIYESIERDHLLLYWFSGIKPKRITNISIPGEFGEYVRECEERYKLEVYFLNLKYDLDILTCACVVIDPVLNLITMGAKTGSDGENVLKGALTEALAVLSATRERNKSFSEEELKKVIKAKPFTEEVSRHDRMNLYASNLGIKLVRDIFLDGGTVSYEDFIGNQNKNESNLDSSEYIINQFKKLVSDKGPGYHVYLHKFTSKWLSEISYHAVHVFVPSFLKLHLIENLATPLSERLVEFAKINGKEIKNVNDLNSLPHFFP